MPHFPLSCLLQERSDAFTEAMARAGFCQAQLMQKDQALATLQATANRLLKEKKVLAARVDQMESVNISRLRASQERVSEGE